VKIAYFIDNLRGDGTQRALIQLARGLAKRGHTQKVVCLNNSYDERIVNELQNTTAEVRIVGKIALATGYGFVSARAWLKEEHFDAVVTMLFAADVVGRLLGKWASVPRIISSLRARNVHYSLVQRWLVRITMDAADAVVINSPHSKEFAIVTEGVNPDRIFLIPNGVQVGKYMATIRQELLRNELDLQRQGRVIGCVGRLTRQKGIDILLQALSLINNQDFNLVIFGIGEDETALRALAAKLGLESRVKFAGYRQDLPTLLGALDLYVHPARFEGMPNAVLEAMAAACPIVATAVDGVCALIEDGTHGWLVPQEAPERLAKAIDQALGDVIEARRRAELARERVRKHFSVEAMVDAWEAVLTSGKSRSYSTVQCVNDVR
jgi:glycosyltransferase involved in cell wall biosynthesis